MLKRGVVLLRVKSKRGEEEVVPGSCWDVVPGRRRESGLPYLIFSDGSRQEPLPQKAAPFRPSAQPVALTSRTIEQRALCLCEKDPALLVPAFT